MIIDINTEDWTYQDGYYYYNEVLAPEAETKPLFTEVVIDGKSVDNKYIGATFVLDVDGSIVQSENNADTVLEAVGWAKDN